MTAALYPGTRIARPKREEDALQKAEVQYLEILRKQGRLECYAVPNGGQRPKAEAAIMKGLGVRAGVPDLTLLWATCVNLHPHVGMIENKRPDGKGRLTDAQLQWGAWLLANGFNYAVVNNYGEFMATLHKWGLISAREAGLTATIQHQGLVR